MLLVLGLLTTEEACEVLVWWTFVIGAGIFAIVCKVSPWVFAEIMTKSLCLLTLWKVLPFIPGWLLYFAERARDDVHESRTEVEDFRVVLEGQVVGEARRRICHQKIGGGSDKRQHAAQYGHEAQ